LHFGTASERSGTATCLSPGRWRLANAVGDFDDEIAVTIRGLAAPNVGDWMSNVARKRRRGFVQALVLAEFLELDPI
jgi:hypothetical protein